MRRFTCPKCNATAEREAHQATSKYCVECRVWMTVEESVDDRPEVIYDFRCSSYKDGALT
jgi:hypothetical protein